MSLSTNLHSNTHTNTHTHTHTHTHVHNFQCDWDNAGMVTDRKEPVW